MGRGDSKAEIALDGRLTRLGTPIAVRKAAYSARSVGTYPTTQRHEMTSAGGPAGSPGNINFVEPMSKARLTSAVGGIADAQQRDLYVAFADPESCLAFEP